MKRVLMITHAFPPGAGSGVIRTLKFVKYLPGNGWLPVILTLDEKYSSKKSKEFFNENQSFLSHNGTKKDSQLYNESNMSDFLSTWFSKRTKQDRTRHEP